MMSPFRKSPLPVLATLIAVAAAAPARDAVINRQVAAIDAALPHLKMRERMLAGLSAEGAAVDAYADAGHIRKIAVTALNESGRTMTAYYLAGDGLLRVRTIQMNYPGNAPGNGPARIVSDQTLDFTDGRLAAAFTPQGNLPAPEMPGLQQAALTALRSYLLLMKTPGPDSEGEWQCEKGEADSCTRYVLDNPAPASSR